MAVTAMKVRLGDQYPISVNLYNEDGTPITNDPELISNVAVYINGRGKKYDGGYGLLQYDSINQCWKYPLSLTETYAMAPGKYEVLARVEFVGEEIASETTAPIEIVKSSTKEVL